MPLSLTSSLNELFKMAEGYNLPTYTPPKTTTSTTTKTAQTVEPKKRLPEVYDPTRVQTGVTLDLLSGGGYEIMPDGSVPPQIDPAYYQSTPLDVQLYEGTGITGGNESPLWSGGNVNFFLPEDDVAAILGEFWEGDIPDLTRYTDLLRGYVDPVTIQRWQQDLHPEPLNLGDTSGSGSGGGGGSYGGGGGGGGTAEPEDINWSVGYEYEGAPSWWQGLVPDINTPQSEFAGLMNSLIPFLSPEDQRNVASNLALMYPETFGIYSPEQVDFLPPSAITGELRQQYQSAERAQNLLDLLGQYRTASLGVQEGEAQPSTAYEYLRQVADLMRDYGGVGEDTYGMSRQQYQQLLGGLDPLMASVSGGDLAAYGSLAKALALPFFSAGELVETSRDPITGDFIFGSPNPIFY